MSGKVKITIDVEINEALMEIVKEGMAGMPQMMEQVMKRRKQTE